MHPTPNYYVQRAFGHHAGNQYVFSDLKASGGKDVEERLDKSVVIDKETGDIIIKIVSMLPKSSSVTINLGEEILKERNAVAEHHILSSKDAKAKEWETNTVRTVSVSSSFKVDVPQYSLTVIKIK